MTQGMAPLRTETADSRNTFEDLSGVDITAYANPYDALIKACENNPVLAYFFSLGYHPVQIQSRYSTHRTCRNAQQKAKLLAPDFHGLILDPILQRLEDPTIEPGFIDPRNCLVFWARPPAHIRSLVDTVQQELRTLAPKLWLMPIPNLHLTAIEITHSQTHLQIAAIIAFLGSAIITAMTDYTFSQRARLIKPMISYDGAAVALSFLPAAGEGLPKNGDGRKQADDKYTYHHLRRSLFSLATSAGMEINSRYVVPSSHITIGRFLTQSDHATPEKMQAWIMKIEELNAWLEEEFWPRDGGVWEGGEWIVGTERGLDCREGTLWYGGGETVRVGKGF